MNPIHFLHILSNCLLILCSLSLLAGCATFPATADRFRLPIAQIDRGVLIWLPEALLFPPGQSEIDPRLATLCLDRITQLLKENSSFPVILESHTDSLEDSAERQVFSEQRANNLRHALIARGIAADRLQAIGYGDTHPLAFNDSAAGRQLNRRVELIVLGANIDPISQGDTADHFEAAFDKLRRLLDLLANADQASHPPAQTANASKP